MSKRKGIGNKIRFEVFKRDNFTCQYCGESAPDVTLNVDHIQPVSKGGDNDIMNLITSCFECNNGKSNKLLNDDSVIKKQKEQIKELNERRNQIEMMLKWRDELKEINEELINKFIDEIESELDVEVEETGINLIKKWFKKYSFLTLLKALEKSSSQYDDKNKAFNMIPKIAYYIDNPNEDMSEAFYIRGILRNRFHYIDENKVLIMLKKSNDILGSDIVRELALSCTSWEDFKCELKSILDEVYFNG